MKMMIKMMFQPFTTRHLKPLPKLRGPDGERWPPLVLKLDFGTTRRAPARDLRLWAVIA